MLPHRAAPAPAGPQTGSDVESPSAPTPANPTTKPIYARAAVLIDEPSGSVHWSAEAFQVVADLDGEGAREIVRRLPDPALNRVPKRAR